MLIVRGEEKLIEGMRDYVLQKDLDKISELNDAIDKKRLDLINKYGDTIFQPLTDWKPESAVVFRQGIPIEDIISISDIINRAIRKRLKEGRFLVLFDGKRFVYISEEIFMRKVQEYPNDPLFYVPGGESKGSYGGGYGIGFGGFGIKVAGINPGAQIMPLKVVGENGITNSLNIWRALRYAADKEAKVINISLGEKGISKLEQLGINYAYSKGALVVVASGNQGENIVDYGPAGARRALTVGALNIEGTKSIISNYRWRENT